MVLLNRLIEIDDLMLDGHPYLNHTDLCFFLGEYTSRAGYEFGEFNSLISNFKKSLKKKGTAEWIHKLNAIEFFATALATIFKGYTNTNELTFIPIPPSLSKDNLLHDDRIMAMLNLMSTKIGVPLDIRELIETHKDRQPLHQSQNRLNPSQLKKILKFNSLELDPVPKAIVLVDDLITNGTHFRACKDIINAQIPHIDTIGLFLGRRIFHDN